MSDELRLPDDLAATEARLAAHPLPTSGLNRDEMMYRAGWAAAEAKLAATAANQTTAEATRRAAAPSLPFPRQGWPIAAWSMTSAALAASLAVAITLQVQSASREQLAHVPPDSPAPIATFAVASPAPSRSDGRDSAGAVADYLSVITNADQTGLTSPLLALCRRSTGVAAKVADSATNDAAAPKAKTARELRNELLPPQNPPSNLGRPLAWPWVHSTGESI